MTKYCKKKQDATRKAKCFPTFVESMQRAEAHKSLSN